MSKLTLIIIFFLIIWLYKLSYNIYLFIRTKLLYKKYQIFEQNTDTENFDIVSSLPEIKELFIKANIPDDLKVPFDNIMASGTIQPLLNINNTMPEIRRFYNLRFTEALGYFKKNICDTFNPFYWIEFFIYFPQKVLNYVDVVNNIFVKLINIAYWFGIVYLICNNLFK
ncbi:hypothetical protein J6E39_07465 [bacterium]|nr:hypothetical protein [bacterium]